LIKENNHHLYTKLEGVSINIILLYKMSKMIILITKKKEKKRLEKKILIDFFFHLFIIK